MPSIDLHSKVFDEGTLTKLEIFEKYLIEWLPVFIHSRAHDTINICDFFAGTGEDKIKNPGSPKIILKIIDTYIDQIVKNKLQVNILLNDKTKRKIDCLKKNLSKEEERICTLSEKINISYYTEDFDILFEKIMKAIRNQANILFLDQNGLKHVTKDRLLDLENFNHTDYLFFCSSSTLIRFPFSKYFPDFNLPSGCKKEEVHDHLLEYYRSSIPKGSMTRLYPFTIKKKHGVYGLIFGSKNPLGVEKFLRVAWNTNPVNGIANFDIFDDSPKAQLTFDFAKKATKIEKFEKDLRRLIQESKKITNAEIYYYTLENGFTPKHASKVVRKMRDKNILKKFKYTYINYANVVKNKNIVEFQVKG